MSPGRFRRWVVRPAIWLLVLLTLAAAGLWVLVQSDFLRARVRTLVEAQLQDLLSRPVRIGSVAVTLAPLAVEARDVVIPGARPGDRDFAVVPRLLMEGDLTGMRKPHLHLRTIEIDNPQIFLERFPDGSDNVPRPPKRPPRSGEARFQLSIDSLTVRDAVFVMAERMLPMDLDARSVSVEAVGLGGWKLAGQVVSPTVIVGLPNAEPYPVSVAGKVRFERGHMQIESARIAGLQVQAHGEGDVYWGVRREVALRIDGDVHSDFLVRLGYVTDQVQGAARFAGRVDWTPERWSYQAGVDSDALRVFERDLTAVHGVVDGGPGEIVTRIDQAEYRGGKVQGTVRVDMSSRERPTRIDLEVDGADAAGALADQHIPVTAVAGAVRGVVSYRFNFKEAAVGNGEIELQVLPREAAGRLPISGTVPLRLEKGVLRTDSLRIDAPGQHLTASGTVDVESGRGRFDFSLETSDPDRLALLLPPVEGPRLWWPSSGSGVISGTLDLGQGATVADLTLALENVRSPGASGDLLEGALRVSERAVEDLELRLRQGAATLSVSGEVPLGSGPGAEGLAIAVRATEWPLGDVRAWLPEEVAAFPLDGRFTGAVDLSGSTEAPAGSVDGTLRDARWGEVGLGELRAAFGFDEAAVTLARVHLLLPAGEVRAAGTIGLDERPLDIAISAPGLRLDQPPFADVLGSELSGELAVEARLQGTVSRPRGEAHLRQKALALNGQPLSPSGGDASADLRLDWDGENLEADGSLFGLVAVDGGGAFDLDHADLRFVVASDQVRTLADLVAEAPLPEFTGAFTGEAVVKGRFDESVRMAVRLERLEVGFRGHTLTNIEPVEARLDGKGVAIDSLYLGEGGESELFLAGRVGFDVEPVLDLKIQASLPSSWLELVTPTVRATGSFDALATVRGTATRPEINGEGGVRDARVIVLGFPHAFEELRATMLFYPDFVVLDELSARLGGGTLQANGRVDIPVGRPLTYRFQATAREVTLRYPEGWLVRGGGEVTLTSTETGRQVGGALELDRAYYLRDIPIGFSQLLRSLLARQRLQVAETDEVLASTTLNLGLRIPGTLRVRNNLANLRGEADLVVRGTLASPVVFGRVEMERGGTVVYAENEYKVERAILSFANPYRIEPVVDLVAKTEVSSYQVTLNLSGPFDRLRATFASDPPIPDLEVLSLLATGEPATFARELTPDADAGASQGAEAFLAGQAANLIGQRVGTLFGLDKFRVAPLAAGGDAVSSVRVTAGKRLRRNLLLTYSFDPSATQDQFLTVEWRLNTNLALLFTQNGDGSYAVDAKWEKAF